MLLESREQGSFWLALLEFGDNDEERRRNWNVFCRSKFAPQFDHFGLGHRVHNIFEKLIEPAPSQDDDYRLMEFIDRYGDSLSAIDHVANGSIPHMNFNDREFSDDISFAGRTLFGATFRNAVFSKTADFEGVEFIGITDFTKAKFKSEQRLPTGVACFTGSSFRSLAKFDEVQFPYTTKFDGVSWHGLACFNEAKFKPENENASPVFASVDFGQSRFQGNADFSDAVFGVAVECRNATFEGAAEFDKAEFRLPVLFSQTRFNGAVSFWSASFSQPPSFFGSQFHDDLDFGMIDWSNAEMSYSCRSRRVEDSNPIRQAAGNAARAWDRLGLIMGQHGKLPERHDFFRLRMRAQRRRDGLSLLTTANWLFDVTSDFGWGVGRALACWISQMILGAALLLMAALNSSVDELGGWRIVWDSLLVSFANSLAFLRLGSEGGHLHGSHEALLHAVGQANQVVNAVGTVQSVLGPITLFLLLLTLRNRFRIG